MNKFNAILDNMIFDSRNSSGSGKTCIIESINLLNNLEREAFERRKAKTRKKMNKSFPSNNSVITAPKNFRKNNEGFIHYEK
jgi:ABC-type polar amino acid transport system ATPase subunit